MTDPVHAPLAESSASTPEVPSAPESTTTLIFRVVVALGCAVLLIGGAYGGWNAARDGVAEVTADDADIPHFMNNQFECIRNQIVDRVPAGAVVYIGDQAGSGAPDQWHQRLVEMTFRQATITEDRARANYALTVVPGAEGGSCGGLHLAVESI